MSGPSDISPWHWQVAIAQYEHVEQQASLANNKTALLAAASTLIVGTYVSFAKDCPRMFDTAAAWPSTPAFFTWGGGLALLLGLVFSLAAVWPKLRPTGDQGLWRNLRATVSGTQRFQTATSDLLFYSNIALHATQSEYVAAFKKASSERLYDDLLGNIWGKARWLKTRFRFVQAALVLTIFGAVVAAVALYATQPDSTTRLICKGPRHLNPPANSLAPSAKLPA